MMRTWLRLPLKRRVSNQIARDRLFEFAGGGERAVLVSAKAGGEDEIRRRGVHRRVRLDADAPSFAAKLISLREAIARAERIAGRDGEPVRQIMGDARVDLVETKGAFA